MYILLLIVLVSEIECEISSMEKQTFYIDCIYEISSKLINNNHHISIYSKPEHNFTNMLLKKFMDNLRPVINNDYSSRINRINAFHIILKQIQNYLIYFENSLFLKNLLDQLYSQYILNPKGLFIFITDKSENLTEIIQILHHYNIFETMILLLNDTNSVSAYTYQSLFANGACNKESPKVQLVGQYNNFRNLKNPLVFPKFRAPKTFKNCTFTILHTNWAPYVMDMKANRSFTKAVHNHGLEVALITTIAKKFNITTHFVQHGGKRGGWGEINEDGSIDGNLLELHKGHVDVVCGAYGLTANRQIVFDSTMAYLRESIIWCTPYMLIRNEWILATSVLKFETFIAVLCVFFLITFAIWLASTRFTQNEEIEFYKTLSNCFISTLPLIIGVCSKHMPKTKLVRYFVALLLIFSFNFNTAYQTYLTGILSTTKYTQKYSNLYDVFDDGLETYSIPTTLRFFPKDEHDELVQLVRKNWNTYRNAKDCLDKVVELQDRACSIPKLHYSFISDKYFWEINRC